MGKYLFQLKIMENSKKGIWLSSVLIVAFIVFGGGIISGLLTLFDSIFTAILVLLSSGGGIYGVIKSWKLEKAGLYFLLGSIILNCIAQSLQYGMPYIVISYSAIWVIVLFYHIKKFK